MAKKLGTWIASWKCKVCDGTGIMEDGNSCMCNKGWVRNSGNVTS